MEKLTINIPLDGVSMHDLYGRPGSWESKRAQQRLRRIIIKELTGKLSYSNKITSYSIHIDYGSKYRIPETSIANTQNFVAQCMKSLHLFPNTLNNPLKQSRIKYNPDFSENYAEATIIIHSFL